MASWIWVLVVFASLFASMPYSEAIKNTDHLGIILSNTCKINLKNNFSTNCPSYDTILTFFVDTSEKKVSGNFDYSEDGFFERQKPQMKSHTEWYRYTSDPVFWIDPPADLILSGIKRIIITDHDFTYPIRDQEITNASFLLGQSRYVSSTCTYAIISAVDWLFLLGDTIQMMNKNCGVNSTNFSDERRIYWQATEHDITTSKKWKYEQLIKSVSENCRQRCFEYDNPKATANIKNINNNFTISLKENLQFIDDIKYNHTHIEIMPDPCEQDGPLCDLYRYKSKNHTINQGDMIKIRNALAGSM